jgi:tetratricopeptide (TPR) repeat protein
MRYRAIIPGMMLLAALSTSVYAGGKESKGDKLMDRFQFVAATEVYEEALKEEGADPSIRRKLAICYRMLNNPEQTVYWYNDIIDNDSIVDPEDKFYYAQALSSTGKYAEARAWFAEYSSQVPGDGRSVKYESHLDNLVHLYEDSSRFRLSPVSFNSDAKDFSPAYYKDGLVFVSNRENESRKYKWDETPFLDLYLARRDREGNYMEPEVFHKKLNTKYHEGPLAFFDRGRNVVFTRNNVDRGELVQSSSGVNNLNIYFARVDAKGNWSKSVPFHRNDKEHSMGHPTITEDGERMYYISDMPGGYGGTDIYVSTFNGKLWSKPENLGPEVNTAGNEMFPFLHNEEVLYFASNGHGGFGGLDVMKYDLLTGAVSNVGYPINSSRDDFGLILNEDGDHGYLTSNRDSEDGSDNIYEFEFFSLVNLHYELGEYELCKKDEVELVAFSAPNLVITQELCGEGPEAMEKLAALLLADESLVVELRSYADTEGSRANDMNLSAKRAETARDYFIEQGISAERIVTRVYMRGAFEGECVHGPNCTVDHASQGWTEFKVINYIPDENLEQAISEMEEPELQGRLH